MKPSVFIGIDPGLSGAIAFYHPDTDRLDIYDMPTLEVQVGGKWRRKIDGAMLAGVFTLQSQLRQGLTIAVIEQVGGITGQSASAAFVFGKSAGAAEQAAVSAGYPITEVPPGVWKKAMGLVGANKNDSRAKASKELPAHAGKWPLVKHDGRAEAALLALYQSRRSA